MKKLFGFGRMKALAAVAGVLLVAGCATLQGRSASENPGMFTLTGIPAEFEGKGADIALWSSPDSLVINNTANDQSRNKNVPVTTGELTVPLYKRGLFLTTGYTGTETLDIGCLISDEGDVINHTYNMVTLSFTSVRFVNGVAKVNWNDGKPDWAFRADSPAPSTGTTAIPAQATQPAPVAPLVQLPLEKIFVGGTPPQGTRDDYAAVLPTLNDALDWLDIYTRDGGNYAIVMGSDQTANNVVLKYGDKRVTITLTVSGGGRTVKGSGRRGYVFTVGKDATFTVGKDVAFMLEEGVTLSGADDNMGHLVAVGSGGTFIMNGGTLRDSPNSAVYVAIGGSFTMNDGSITGNRSYEGCGVYVRGIFTMNGGTISGNSTIRAEGTIISDGGGGVLVDDGTFTMNDGTISGNSTYESGGGVRVGTKLNMNINHVSTFIMNGGTISGNESGRGGGGGVYVGGGAYGGATLFTMTGGTISGNTGSGVNVRGTFTMNAGTISGNRGSGVDFGSGTFTMSGGTINGNTASGVAVGRDNNNGTFTMSGGTIGGNTTSENGGGVYVASGTFTKSGTGGIIYGSNAPAGQANKAPSEAAGHAVYVAGERPQKRTTTAGETTALDSTKNLVQGGGWE
jgi:hypothetical protein